ncbi:nuclear transport factor 2 family protein [Rasiella sp. SM2506]|uniref:nuclear transport factor 2 family protein n=1 Tax=Rasiella sp. SM2506 TaxID=3423914 RepID=UPI003D7B9D26
MKYILQILVLLISITCFAQVEKTSELYLQMKQMDSIVFDAGFNNCDLIGLELILSEDLEFYHDIGGIQDKAEFMEAIAKNICGNPSGKLTRELIKGSLEVFPLKNNTILYGAYVNGEHEFFRKETDKKLLKTGYAKFSSYYELQNDAWKLKRVFSFDHKTAN